ncbi:hypothetical protein D6777_02105 [Candidatus Woesearchaeota archaeon]|nr:MAG: hypothetical protein D6777_02105 [Candidatus Woesearchaeota archaeon]
MLNTKDRSYYIVPFGTKVKANAVLDFGEFYQELQRWFTYNGYTWQEVKYRVVENPDGSKQVELRWFGVRKLDDYVSAEIQMDLQVFHGDVEANIDGVKKKMQKGGFEFRLGSKLIKNWGDFWGSDKLKGWAEWKKEIYERFLIKDRLLSFENIIGSDIMRLISEIKAYMKLYGA